MDMDMVYNHQVDHEWHHRRNLDHIVHKIDHRYYGNNYDNHLISDHNRSNDCDTSKVVARTHIDLIFRQSISQLDQSLANIVHRKCPSIRSDMSKFRPSPPVRGPMSYWQVTTCPVPGSKSMIQPSTVRTRLECRYTVYFVGLTWCPHEWWGRSSEPHHEVVPPICAIRLPTIGLPSGCHRVD